MLAGGWVVPMPSVWVAALRICPTLLCCHRLQAPVYRLLPRSVDRLLLRADIAACVACLAVHAWEVHRLVQPLTPAHCGAAGSPMHAGAMQQCAWAAAGNAPPACSQAGGAASMACGTAHAMGGPVPVPAAVLLLLRAMGAYLATALLAVYMHAGVVC